MVLLLHGYGVPFFFEFVASAIVGYVLLLLALLACEAVEIDDLPLRLDICWRLLFLNFGDDEFVGQFLPPFRLAHRFFNRYFRFLRRWWGRVRLPDLETA